MNAVSPLRRALLFLLALLTVAAAIVVAARALHRAPEAEAPAPDAAPAEQGAEALPAAASVPEALALFDEALRRGETCFRFQAEGEWTTEALNLLSSELLANSSEIAAETGMYHYELTPLPDGGAAVCIEAEYRVDQELLLDRNLELRATLEELAGQLRAQGGDDRARYLAAARIVVSRASFDRELSLTEDTEALSQEQRIARSAYGALVSGETVCTGYAMAYKALCDRLGLPCRVVSGRNGGEHAWNAIRLDGRTLFMDCTFADILQNEAYFFMDGTALDARGYTIPNAALVFPGEFGIME